MVKYEGGKSRIGHWVFEMIKKYDKGQDYLEPFFGIGSVAKWLAIDKEYPDRKLYGTDANPDVILLMKALQKGWIPPNHIGVREYETLRNSKHHSALRGFAGISSSYNGHWFQHYSDADTKLNAEQFVKIGQQLAKVHLKHTSYTKLKPKGMLIYADPPYSNSNVSNPYLKGFDHEQFWIIMRRWSKDNTVIISSYEAPEDFKVIGKIKIKYNLPTHDGFKSTYRIEKLFMVK